MVRSWLGRRIEREMLDSACDSDARGNLNDLRRIHHYFGGHRILAKLLGEWFGRDDRFTVLDIGAGGCVLGEMLPRSFPNATVVSLDASVRNLAAGGGIRVAADAFQLPFAVDSVDVVCCNFLLHHFRDEDVERLLRSMYSLSRRGVIAVDLQRGWISRRFLPATAWLFGWSKVTLHDGPVSVDAAFQKPELVRLAEAAGFVDASVRVHLPWFRLSLACRREAVDAAEPRPVVMGHEGALARANFAAEQAAANPLDGN